MALLPPGSSENLLALASVAAPSATPLSDKLASLSFDEPLPETYADDAVQLLVQSPYRLYLYWNHAHDPFATLRKALGEAAQHYRLAVRLIDVNGGEARTYAATPARNYWFDARPGKTYRAEVGFAADARPFIRLLSSAVRQTPPTGVSSKTDDAPSFHVRESEFARVLNETGYAGDALEVALEAADRASRNESTQALARRLSAPDAPILEESDLPELRALIAALAFGANQVQLRARLSRRLARWLDAIVAAHGARIDAKQLLELLRQMFGFELEYEETFTSEGEVLTHRPSSFAWSASYFSRSERRVRVWLPSMNAGRQHGSPNWLPSMSVDQRMPVVRWRKFIY